MAEIALDIYDDRPKAMTSYLAAYGWHFSKKACEDAVSRMKKMNPATGKKERIDPMTKEEVDELLKKHGVTLEHNRLYDYVYTANRGRADVFKSSVPDEAHLALYVKDVIDDPDNPGGNELRHFYADCAKKDTPIEWEDWL